MNAEHLIDANVLIALVITDHEHHQRAMAWVSNLDAFAVSPVVEGALVRFLIRTGESPVTVKTILDSLHEHPLCEFWPDDVSYREADLAHVHGHRQVTDAYLVSLAARHHAELATFDEGLSQATPNRVLLIP